MQTFSRLPGGQSVKKCIFPFAHRANGKEGLHMPIAGVANGIPHCKYRLLVVAGGQTEEHCAQCRLRGGKRYDALQIPFAVGQTGNARCKYRLLVGKRGIRAALTVCWWANGECQPPTSLQTDTLFFSVSDAGSNAQMRAPSRAPRSHRPLPPNTYRPLRSSMGPPHALPRLPLHASRPSASGSRWQSH